MGKRLHLLLATLLISLTGLQLSHAEVFQWKDSQGRTHYGDRPPANVKATSKATLKRIRWYQIKSIPDGDTIHLRGGYKVRLLGLNTPEVAKRGTPAQAGGLAASHFLQQFLKGKKLRLETDKQRRDRYDRLLAHVYTEDKVNINALLIRKGYAHTTIIPPNVKHAAEYRTLEAKARKAAIGLWALDDYQVFDASSDLLQRRNQFSRVKGTVTRIEPHKKFLSLWMGKQFHIRIDKDAQKIFQNADIELNNYKGKTLIVRGWIKQRKGKPVMWLVHPFAVESQ